MRLHGLVLLHARFHASNGVTSAFLGLFAMLGTHGCHAGGEAFPGFRLFTSQLELVVQALQALRMTRALCVRRLMRCALTRTFRASAGFRGNRQSKTQGASQNQSGGAESLCMFHGVSFQVLMFI